MKVIILMMLFLFFWCGRVKRGTGGLGSRTSASWPMWMELIATLQVNCPECCVGHACFPCFVWFPLLLFRCLYFPYVSFVVDEIRSEQSGQEAGNRLRTGHDRLGLPRRMVASGLWWIRRLQRARWSFTGCLAGSCSSLLFVPFSRVTTNGQVSRASPTFHYPPLVYLLFFFYCVPPFPLF